VEKIEFSVLRIRVEKTTAAFRLDY
jgi:hypothetical protein